MYMASTNLSKAMESPIRKQLTSSLTFYPLDLLLVLNTEQRHKAIARLPGKRQREHSPSLPAPLSSPSPASLRTPLRRSHIPSLNLNTKAKSKVNDKIRDIDVYAFKGLNRHEAQDAEWSTLPARKRVKSETYVDASSVSPGLICVSFSLQWRSSAAWHENG
jgi:hypothetical protein